MYLKYEKACIEAGLSSEETRKIRRLFENDRKKLKIEKTMLQERNILVVSLDMDLEDINENNKLIDTTCNVEEEAIWNIYMEKLLECLEQLTPEEKSNVIALYDPKISFVQYAKDLGIPKTTLIEKTEKVVEKLRDMMGIKIEIKKTKR